MTAGAYRVFFIVCPKCHKHFMSFTGDPLGKMKTCRWCKEEVTVTEQLPFDENDWRERYGLI